jgi:hypothetical protein
MSAVGPLSWYPAEKLGEASAGCMVLARKGGIGRLILDFQCYVLPLSPPRFLVWQEQDKQRNPVTDRSIVLRIFDADQLQDIPDVQTACVEMRERAMGMYYSDGVISTAAIPLHLGEGIHRFPLAEEFHETGELLILADTTSDGAVSNYWDQMHRCIYVVRPKQGTIEVILGYSPGFGEEGHGKKKPMSHLLGQR